MYKFFKCSTQYFVKVKKVIEHKAGYYYQNRFNNNGYFSSNGLFVTYCMFLSMLMIEQIECLTFWPGHYCYYCSIFVMVRLDTRDVHFMRRCAHFVLNDYTLKHLNREYIELTWTQSELHSRLSLTRSFLVQSDSTRFDLVLYGPWVRPFNFPIMLDMSKKRFHISKYKNKIGWSFSDVKSVTIK